MFNEREFVDNCMALLNLELSASDPKNLKEAPNQSQYEKLRSAVTKAIEPYLKLAIAAGVISAEIDNPEYINAKYSTVVLDAVACSSGAPLTLTFREVASDAVEKTAVRKRRKVAKR